MGVVYHSGVDDCSWNAGLYWSHSGGFLQIPVLFLWIPVPFLWIPVDSCGFWWIPVDSCGFLQEWGGHCKVLGVNSQDTETPLLVKFTRWLGERMIHNKQQ